MVAVDTTYSVAFAPANRPRIAFLRSKQPVGACCQAAFSQSYVVRPGTPSAHNNWRARDDSNGRPLPQELSRTVQPSNIKPVAAGGRFVY
jgi:hypothetical protein